MFVCSRLLDILSNLPLSGWLILILSILPLAWPFIVSFGIMTPTSSDQSGAHSYSLVGPLGSFMLRVVVAAFWSIGSFLIVILLFTFFVIWLVTTALVFGAVSADADPLVFVRIRCGKTLLSPPATGTTHACSVATRHPPSHCPHIELYCPDFNAGRIWRCRAGRART